MIRDIPDAEVSVRFGKLVCPSCDSTYLHHRAVYVFDRTEDDAKVTLTVVNPGGDAGRAVVLNEGSGNPSARRNGLLVSFECENCAARLSLALAQHKGETEVMWRNGGRVGA